MIRITLIIVFFLLLTACATLPQSEDHTILSSQSCLAFYAEFDAFIDSEAIRDIQATRVPDYPFLSANRFLVSFKSELDSKDKLDYWLSLLANTNVEARQLEWLNLSLKSQQKLRDNFLLKRKFNQYLEKCSSRLLAELSEDDKKAVIDSAAVKNDYSMLKRFFGLYPLTSLYVSRQINKHQALTKKSFEKELSEIAIEGRLVRYSIDEDSRFDKQNFDRDNPLRIPIVNDRQLNQLFVQYAPIVEVDEQDENDIVGRVSLNDKAYPKFVNDKAIFYVLPSYTRFNGQVLLQLNYVFWFSSRPRKSTFDIYSGRLDGLIWRVTLDGNGEPLMYDSVHNCGCYHKFYLTDKVFFNERVALQEPEPPFVAQQRVEGVANNRLVLRIGSVAHFLNRVYVSDSLGEARKVEVKPYATLRSLPSGNKKRSLFASDGLIKGTARAERWLLWPMGVPSAGAMRQWGHHAVAFVGQRYFDDPALLEKYFIKAP